MRPQILRTVPLLALLVVSAGSGSLAAQPEEQAAPAVGEVTVDRLVDLCRTWTTVKYLHPWLYSREIDWDRAFVDAVPAVRAAESSADYRQAVAGMLATLDDPVTGLKDEIGNEAPAKPAEPGEPGPLIRRPAEGVVLLDLAGSLATGGGSALVQQVRSLDLGEELAGAKGLVVDLRVTRGDLVSRYYAAWALGQLMSQMAPAEVVGPSFRWPTHWGYRPQSDIGSGGYRTAFVQSLPTVIAPSDPERAPERIVFVTDERSRLSDGVVALRAGGYAAIVSEGPLDRDAVARQVEIELSEGLVATLRTAELVSTGALGGGVEADVVVEPGAPGGGSVPDPALAAALALLDEPSKSARQDRPTPDGSVAASSPGRWRPERRYPEMAVPSPPYRMLASCRLWGVIETFYPYLDLIGDWEGSFRAAIPEFLDADSEEAYVLAILRLAAEIEDGHTKVGGDAVERVLGSARPPVRMREIEGHWLVTEVGDLAIEDLAKGDEVHAIDGVAIEEQIERHWPLITASTTEARRGRAALLPLLGPPDTTVTLTVSGTDGRRREVTLRRGEAEQPPEPEAAPPYHLLDGHPNLGYADLTRLEIPQVDAMFDAFAETDGILFDLRGYPRGTAWSIGPRINTNGAETWARFRRREVSIDSFGAPEAGFFFSQPLPKTDKPLYEGETVMLIDQRAISQSEHTALGFREAAGTLFVGTRTAGANGDTTSLVLPGDLEVFFTGHDVRHADGSQLQRVGIQPDVEVAPTVEGFRAGRDEVLERGVEALLELVEER